MIGKCISCGDTGHTEKDLCRGCAVAMRDFEIRTDEKFTGELPHHQIKTEALALHVRLREGFAMMTGSYYY